MKRTVCLTLVFLLPVILMSAGTSYAEPDISYFDVKIVNNDGEDSPNILSHRYVVDTISDAMGTTFILRAQISLQASPANLLIVSDEGSFNCYVHVSGLSSYLRESGMRIQLDDGEDHYYSDLREDNEFTSYVRAGDESRMVLKPNVMYPISIMTLDDVEHEATPETVENVTVEFTAQLKDGFHQVAFFSEGELVEAYKLADGQAIRPLPVIERDGYSFEGWYLKNGEPIQEGYVVTEEDGDIIAYARWSEIVSNSRSFNWIIPLIITAIILSLLIIILTYRRRKSS